MYCVRCGDKIDKNELVCDKCGLHFTVVDGRGATVYINQTPTPPPNTQAGKKKKKKSGLGWLVVFVTLASVALAVFTGIVLLGLGIFAGVFLFMDDGTVNEQVVVNDPGTTQNSTPIPPAIVYENTDQAAGNEAFSNALREPFVKLKGDGTDTVTVMVYMNGSDLESDNGFATEDLREMLNSTLSDNVNVVIQTGGTKKWKTQGISSKHSQRFLVQDKSLQLIDDSLEQLDITNEETLKDFIVYCETNYPANRNILILWDHGGGAVYGYGVDENLDDPYAALTIDEIKRAIEASGVKFEMIGFDACLMGGLETACALCDVSDFLVASEDFESGNGWEYQNWLTLLGYNSSTPMTDVAKVIVDDFIKESIYSDSDGVLSLIDLRYAKLLYSTWTEFAYANENQLLTYDYTMSMERSQRAPDSLFDRNVKKDFWDWFSTDYTMETYCYAVDIMALASTMNTDEANALASVMKSAVLYCSSTSGDSYMTGLSVTLPYGDYDFYDELKGVFAKSGFDNDYLNFLAKFAGTDNLGNYDWDSYDYGGWDSYDSYYDDSWNSDDYWNDYDWDSYYDYYDDYYYDDYSDGWYYDDGGYWDYSDWFYDDSGYWDYGDYYYDDSNSDYSDYYDSGFSDWY